RPERGVPSYQKYEPRLQRSARRYGGWLRASANPPTIALLLEHPSVAVKGLADLRRRDWRGVGQHDSPGQASYRKASVTVSRPPPTPAALRPPGAGCRVSSAADSVSLRA